MGFYATSPVEDLQNLAYAIAAYETREEGTDRFKEARSNAASLLANTWELVERLGRALQADPSGRSDAVAALLAEARRASD